MLVWLLFCCLLTSLATATSQNSLFVNGSTRYIPKPRLGDDDDPRFSIEVSMGDTKLPPTPVLMNAVELSARYAEMDFLSRTPQRRGIVLPQFPQIEIAVLPAPPARSVEVRLILYTIYALVIDMIYVDGFYESEVAVSWENVVKAHVYFTLPMDNDLHTKNQTREHHSSASDNGTVSDEMADGTVQPLNTVFDWHPVYKPNGKNLFPNDVFVLALGAIKVIAPHRITEQIPGPIHIGSGMINAHMQIYLDNSRRPRPIPPFLRYGHALEAVRRVPGWQLARHKFAEFFASIEISRRPVAVILMEEGPYVGPGDRNVTIS
ncbi:MAG: hypothetical protein Q9218_003902 [Villophora microphyllina]